ncbi:MAG: DUF1428 family protein [Bacteroidetes bacterium]|jgi:uncharacterized protein YbaA (DUF1428 family)|nr:DUF1428 family protein [Bacteroidota bacterium]
MGRYIDGYVLPVPRSRLPEYKRAVRAIANIWKEYGALDYVELQGDDLSREGTLPFPDLLSASEDEVVVLGWVVFDSREARDLANRKVEADPRVAELVEPLLESPNPVFNPERMAYGGFRPLIPSSGEDAE